MEVYRPVSKTITKVLEGRSNVEAAKTTQDLTYPSTAMTVGRMDVDDADDADESEAIAIGTGKSFTNSCHNSSSREN